MIAPKHIGYNSHRLSLKANNPVENVFAELWKEENNNENRRYLLVHLIPSPCSQENATVAATIIQWLGSNVGRAFIADAIKKSPELKEYLKHCYKPEDFSK